VTVVEDVDEVPEEVQLEEEDQVSRMSELLLPNPNKIFLNLMVRYDKNDQTAG
jgi:hypothetical protein